MKFQQQNVLLGPLAEPAHLLRTCRLEPLRGRATVTIASPPPATSWLGSSTSNIKAAAWKFNLNLKSLTGPSTGEAGVNHGDNEAAAATADSVDSIVSPNECGDINLDEGQARVSGKVMIMRRGKSPCCRWRGKPIKWLRPGGAG